MIRRTTLALWFCAAIVPAWADPTVPPLDGYRLDHYNAPVPDVLPGGRTVHTDELHALMAATHAVLVDVLPAQRRPETMQPGTPWMPLPHRDLPGSIWLPETGRGAIPPEVDAYFERELERASASNHAAPVVFYCRANCWMSWNAAKRAVEHGWTNVLWYPDGPDAWEAAGLPLAEAKSVAME